MTKTVALLLILLDSHFSKFRGIGNGPIAKLYSDHLPLILGVSHFSNYMRYDVGIVSTSPHLNPPFFSGKSATFSMLEI